MKNVGRDCHEAGIALIDVLLVFAILTAAVGMAVPGATEAADAARARAAAGYLAGRLRHTRIQAVRTGVSTALVFGLDDGSFRLCRDGNANGVRRLDIESGDDECSSAERISEHFPNVTVGLDASVPDLDMVTGRDDGVRFGRSAMASCSPVGHCTPGSIYLRSNGGTHYGVRVSGITGRARLWRFDSGAGGWGPA